MLYVDWSSGFGGSSKSLALTLKGLSEVRKLMITAQDPGIVQELFGSLPRWRFRRWINYRTRARITDAFSPSGLSIPGTVMLKAYALLDIGLTALNTLRLAHIISKYHVDLVHINNGFLPHEGVLAARMNGVPVVGHLRGIPRMPLSASVVRKVREAGCTIAVSDAAAAELREAVPDAVIVTVYDPVDLDRVRRASGSRQKIREELQAKDNDLLVGIFGRVVRWKGQLEFVAACVAAMKDDSRIRAVVVGDVSDGSQKYMQEIREAVTASPFPERFIFTGYRSDVEEMFAAMDIVVHASIVAEPFGMVIPEAMAAGKAVVATDAGGPREIVTHGLDGLLVPPGNVSAMCEAIVQLAQDESLRAELGQQAERTVAERYTVEQNAREITRIYEQVLWRHSGAATPAKGRPS